MNRTVYVNGEYLPETEAKVSIFDRGFLMADAVYEVTSVLGGKLIDFDGHIVRLQRSLDELEINNPHTREEWLSIHRELVRTNDLVDGGIYLQTGYSLSPQCTLQKQLNTMQVVFKQTITTNNKRETER